MDYHHLTVWTSLHRHGWRYLLIAAAVSMVMLPVLHTLLRAFALPAPWMTHVWSVLMPHYLRDTLLLLVGTGALSSLIGIGSAWLVSYCEFAGRRMWQLLLILPFTIPPYLAAYIYADLGDFSGPIQSALRAFWGWQAQDYWFPQVRSLGGAIVVMSSVLYPYIYILTRNAFEEQSHILLLVNRTCGFGVWHGLRRITLPLARPAIIIGLVLCLFEVMGDFGIAYYFDLNTLSLGIFEAWLNLGDLTSAAQIACAMVLVVGVLFLLERSAVRSRAYFVQAEHHGSIERICLHWRGTVCAHLICGLIFTVGFGLPVWYLLFLYTNHAASVATGWLPALHTLMLAAATVIVVTTIALLLTHSARLLRSAWVVHLLSLLLSGYALPGMVLALGILSTLAWLHQGLSLPLLSGTLIALFYAYTVRFLPIAVGGLNAAFQRIPWTQDFAVMSLGNGAWGLLRRLHLPLVRGALISAGLLIFIDTAKELTATLLLRPFNFETLATFIHQYAVDEQLEVAAGGALWLIILLLPPVCALHHMLNRRSSAHEVVDAL